VLGQNKCLILMNIKKQKYLSH